MSTPDKKHGEKTLLTEAYPPSNELLDKAIADAKAVRAQALQNARKAVEDVFNTRGEIISTPSETDAAVKKFLTNETPELLWMTHEGSLLLSALIGISENGEIDVSLSELPDGDKELIRNVFEALSGVSWQVIKPFHVKFDKYRNFEVSAININSGEDMKFSLGNWVSSIPPGEARSLSNVKVERKGKEILIGDRIKLERDRIQNLVQPEQVSSGQSSRAGFQPRQKVAGRNAYEIRQDIIENAIEVVRLSNTNERNCYIITDDVLDIAERLYDFVEHKK